jgi:outer membrane immunogenic protein
MGAIVKRLLQGCVTCAALAASGSASAADMPLKAPPPVPVYSWTGFYLGGNGGYGWRDRSVSFSPNDPVAADSFGGLTGTALPNTSFKTSGGLGGIQLGYNWQLNRAWVGGLEADLDVSNIKGSGTSSNIINGFLLGAVPGTATATDKIQWFGTARARLGFLVANELLLYGTGGFAYGRVALDANYVISSSFGTGNVVSGFSYFCVAGAPCFAGASARVQTGWTAGAGAEWAVGNSSLTFKLEYLYVNLGAAQSFPMTATATLAGLPTPSSLTVRFSDSDFHIVRVGLNYSFGGPAVASY